jgi:hypothetical protein
MEDSLRAARQLVELDPYFTVGWARLWDAARALDHRNKVEESVQRINAINPNHFAGKFGWLDYALQYRRTDEARAALAQIVTRSPKDAEFAQTLLPWALGESDVDPIKLRAAIADAPAGEASNYFIARQDIDGYNSDIESQGAVLESYYFANLYSSRPAGHAMLRDPRVKARLVRYGFPAYWREKGWPSGCRPLGETDFECGLDTLDSK